MKHGQDGFADADGCVDLSGGDHVDIKRDGTSIGIRVDPIGSIKEFLCSAFVIVWSPKSLSVQGTSPKFGGVVVMMWSSQSVTWNPHNPRSTSIGFMGSTGATGQ